MLHLESAGEHWVPRYFKLQPNSLAYFDISAPADVSRHGPHCSLSLKNKMCFGVVVVVVVVVVVIVVV